MTALLTANEARQRGLETDLSDAALDNILAECDALVLQKHGQHYDSDTPLVVTFRQNQARRYLYVRRPIATVSEVKELDRDEVLAADDYEVGNGGQSLLRLYGGTYGFYTWDVHVRLTYLPEDDNALRRRIMFELAQLYLADTKLASTRIGDFAATGRDMAKEQKRILAQLRYNSIGVFSGQQWAYGE